jgi:hypothetical protein
MCAIAPINDPHFTHRNTVRSHCKFLCPLHVGNYHINYTRWNDFVLSKSRTSTYTAESLVEANVGSSDARHFIAPDRRRHVLFSTHALGSTDASRHDGAPTSTLCFVNKFAHILKRCSGMLNSTYRNANHWNKFKWRTMTRLS